MMEHFHQSDIERFEIQNNQLHSKFTWSGDFRVEYDEEVRHISLPTALFMHIINNRRYDILKSNVLFPNIVKVHKLDRGDNPWLKDTHYLGFQQDSANKYEMWLYLDQHYNHSIVSLLWLMMHEFRHKMQYFNLYMISCLDNTNRDKWLSTYKCRDTALHVFHEIDPAEVDVNVFACEMLDIPYPGSKFEITNDTLKLISSPA